MSAFYWRPEIELALEYVWPKFPREAGHGQLWVEAQVHAESGGDPAAISPCGAVGLLQLMPVTAAELGVDRLDPKANLRGGVAYLRQQYDHLPEIPDARQRLLWSFASYNMGRAYANRAIKIWQDLGVPGWWRWDCGKLALRDGACEVGGKRPRFREVDDYVRRIEAYYSERWLEPRG